MAKTIDELTQAHKRTLEVFTGKHVQIILSDKQDELLKNKSLTEILLSVERYNPGTDSVVSPTVSREVVRLRKIFCLLANRAGYSAKKTGIFLDNRDHTTVTYNLRTGANLLNTDAKFQQLYNSILRALVGQ